ncbi:hypothetical protein BDC45DRAFT_84777 [Circinella umbellata]|nr:hypothetical protein BDC45DRAFT_84777 [Circinella umbellata]
MSLLIRQRISYLITTQCNSTTIIRIRPTTKTLPPCFSYSTQPLDKKSKTVLTEYVYGRTRIYTSLQTMAKGKPATSGKTRIGSPITSPPLAWQWLQRSENKLASSSTEIGGDSDDTMESHNNNNNKQFQILGSLKQSMREMFLPVGIYNINHVCI